METKNATIIVLLVIAIFAIIGLVLFFKTSSQGAVTYQQLIHRDNAVYLNYYNVCSRGLCGDQATQIGHVQTGEPNFLGNALCECPDGRRFQIDYHRTY